MSQESDTMSQKIKRFYIGLNIPFQGVGFYKVPVNKVMVWNLTPFSFEAALSKQTGIRFSVYTVFTTPQPKRIQEFEFNIELPYYFKRNTKDYLCGIYLGPVLMLQANDQDSGANLGGPGLTSGYKGRMGKHMWFRTGLYAAYHHYLWGPREDPLKITKGSKSGGLFMGLTLFELGWAL